MQFLKKDFESNGYDKLLCRINTLGEAVLKGHLYSAADIFKKISFH